MKDDTNNFWQKIKNNFNEYKPAWIAVVVVLALAVVAAVAPWENKNNVASEDTSATDGCQPGFKFDVYTGEPCEEKKIVEEKEEAPAASDSTPAPSESPTGQTSTSNPKKYPSLAEALKIYEGNSFAVVSGCAINPASQQVAKGTRIMVHNATGSERTVLVAGRTLVLKPYYYRTVALDTAGEVTLRCDGKVAGKIIVQ